MRAILAASLLLSPLLFPAAAVASKPANDVSATSRSLRVSTGVYRPSILQTTAVLLNPTLYATFPSDALLVLKLRVDPYGRPENVGLIMTSNRQLDKSVIAAVRQFRWRPAYLDGRPIPDDVRLKVVVSR